MAASTSMNSGRLSITSINLTPLPTPFYFSAAGGGAAPSCPASIIDPAESSTTYCCNGLLIDVMQPILAPLSDQQQPFYFENLRCCSGDPNIAMGSVTSCSTGKAATLATSVAEVTRSSSGIETGVGSISTSTSTVLTSSDVTTTIPAATIPTSKSEARGPRVGRMIGIFPMLSIIWAQWP